MISSEPLGRKTPAGRSLCDSSVSLGYQYCVVACLQGTKPGNRQAARAAWARMRNRGSGLARADVASSTCFAGAPLSLLPIAFRQSRIWIGSLCFTQARSSRMVRMPNCSTEMATTRACGACKPAGSCPSERTSLLNKLTRFKCRCGKPQNGHKKHKDVPFVSFFCASCVLFPIFSW